MFSRKKNGFLLIEVLISLAIFILVVKSIGSMHASLIDTQRMVINRLTALALSVKSIEGVKGGISDDSSGRNKRFTLERGIVPVNFALKGEKSLVKLKQQGTVTSVRVVVAWDVAGKHRKMMTLVGGAA